MATITTIGENDYPADSRAVINTNFDNLNTDKIETSVISTDGTLGDNSDTEIPSEKATKTYVDTAVAGVSGAVFPDAEVFAAGAAPTSMTDLDLSGTIGSNSAIVLLKVFLNDSSAGNYHFRPNGDTGDYVTSVNNSLNFISFGGATGTATVVVATDSSGVVEWMCSAARTTTVTLVAYIL